MADPISRLQFYIEQLQECMKNTFELLTKTHFDEAQSKFTDGYLNLKHEIETLPPLKTSNDEALKRLYELNRENQEVAKRFFELRSQCKERKIEYEEKFSEMDKLDSL